MSWNIQAAGKAADVKERFAKRVEVESAQSYNSEAAKAVLAAHFLAVAAQCGIAGEKTVVAESSGHIDGSSASSSLSVRTFYEY